VFYVRVATRGVKAAAQGSPRQAVDYITDGHDMRRDPGYSDTELAYIARMDPGWKTDLEGGRVPLVGFGTTAGVLDEAKIAAVFEDSCVPGDPRGTTGYKTITFTLPKEVSLFAEGHREGAKAAMYAAVQQTLDRAFAGKHYAAAAAIHTRNEAGEIHYHAHVLVGKFAQEPATGRVVSLNSKRGGNGPARVRDLKMGWREAIEKEFRERLQLGIEQRAPNTAPALVMPDGSRLDPLSRASRRQLEQDIAPWYSVPDKSGAMVQRQLRLSAMDDRIFEVASGDKAGWDLDSFRRLFPDRHRFAERHEKRAETLKAMGYLTQAGGVTPDFRLHFSIRHGINTPELQRLRIDLVQQVARGARPPGARREPRDLWETLDKHEHLRMRVERLGFNKGDWKRIIEEANANRPTPERLAQLRIQAAVRTLVQPSNNLPKTKTVIRAFVDVQRARLQRVYLVVRGAATFNLAENKKLSDQLHRAAERDYPQAKDRQLAQIARGLRPIFGALRIALPRQARRLEKAVERSARLAYSQDLRQVRREEIQRAYVDWRKQFIDGPNADLKRAARDLERPEQQAGRADVEASRNKIELRDVDTARQMYQRGFEVLRTLGRPDAGHLRSWAGREGELVQAVFTTAKNGGGSAAPLQPDEYQAAVRAGQIGRLLTREEQARAPNIPAGTRDAEAFDRLGRRLDAFGIRSPIGRPEFKSLAPAELQKALEGFRKAGLLDEGPGWTLRAGGARALAQELGKTTERAVDAERVLTDALLKNRSAK
jgi:hypothetical protein